MRAPAYRGKSLQKTRPGRAPCIPGHGARPVGPRQGQGDELGGAGQVGVAGHCSVGDGAILTAQSGISHDIPAGQMISGSPGFDNRAWLRAVSLFQRLPELVKRLSKLEARMNEKPGAGDADSDTKDRSGA